METEVWKPISGFEKHYEVSNLGRVKRLTGFSAGQCLRPGISGTKYPNVVLHVHNKRNTRRIHLLVAEAFLGPRPKGYEVNHKDGNKQNAAASNLEYVTPSENHLHAFRIGLRPSKRYLSLQALPS